MEKHALRAYIPPLVLVALVAASMLAEAGAVDPELPVKRTRHIAACLLTLMRDVAPPVAFGMMILGAIIYIAAAGSEKTRMMGKHYFLMGVAGVLCIFIVVALAAMPPFSVTPAQCTPLYP